MQKMFKNPIVLCCILTIFIIAFGCSDRGVSPEIDNLPDGPPDDATIKTVTDSDGNMYPTVIIGDQLWMAENLRVTRFTNGNVIPLVRDNKAWANIPSAAYCYYGNDSTNTDSYGLLYNWYAVNDKRDIAPPGWHVPSDADWQILINYLGGSSIAGSKLKNAVGWSKDGAGSNSSQFNAMPAGIRISNGIFDGKGFGTSFWSSTGISTDGAWSWWLSYVGSGIGRDDANRLDGFSIRCVRD